MFCTFLYFTYYGMMAVSITPNHQVAAIVASAFYAIFNLFSGFLMPKPNLPEWWIWYYWLCPTAWTVNGLLTSQYGDEKQYIEINSATGGIISLRINDFLSFNFGFSQACLYRVAIVLMFFPLFFALIFILSVKTLNFQRR